MGYFLTLILSYSIVPAVFAAVIRFKRLRNEYWPMMVCLALGMLNEIVSTMVISNGHSNALNTNIFYLLEALLMLFQFSRWGLFYNIKSNLSFAIIFIVGWLVETSQINPAATFICWFRIATAVAVIYMSIKLVLQFVNKRDNDLDKDPRLLFCFGFCIYYLCVLLTEYFIYDQEVYSPNFRDLLFRTLSFCNLATNIIYLRALLWSPMKRTYITASC